MESARALHQTPTSARRRDAAAPALPAASAAHIASHSGRTAVPRTQCCPRGGTARTSQSTWPPLRPPRTLKSPQGGQAARTGAKSQQLLPARNAHLVVAARATRCTATSPTAHKNHRDLGCKGRALQTKRPAKDIQTKVSALCSAMRRQAASAFRPLAHPSPVASAPTMSPHSASVGCLGRPCRAGSSHEPIS